MGHWRTLAEGAVTDLDWIVAPLTLASQDLPAQLAYNHPTPRVQIVGWLWLSPPPDRYFRPVGCGVNGTGFHMGP